MAKFISRVCQRDLPPNGNCLTAGIIERGLQTAVQINAAAAASVVPIAAAVAKGLLKSAL